MAELNELFNMRPLYEISAEILHTWKDPYFGAVPYLKAMMYLKDRYSYYLYDTGESIIRYALGNMRTFKGENARRLKAELREHLAYPNDSNALSHALE